MFSEIDKSKENVFEVKYLLVKSIKTFSMPIFLLYTNVRYLAFYTLQLP